MDSSDRAISPVIGVGILIAIVVALSAGLFVATTGIVGDAQQQPVKSVSVSSEADVTGTVVVRHGGGDTVPMEDVKVIVETSDGRQATITDLPLDDRSLSSATVEGDLQLDMREGAVSETMTEDEWTSGEPLAFRVDEDISSDETVKVTVVDEGANKIISESYASGSSFGSVMVLGPDFSINGTVTDSSGDPVEGATVYLHSNERTTTTDADGEFRFGNVSPGMHRVWVVPQERELAASGEVEFQMTPDGAVPGQLPLRSTISNNEVDFTLLEMQTATYNGNGESVTAEVNYQNKNNTRDIEVTLTPVSRTDDYSLLLPVGESTQTIEGSTEPTDETLVLDRAITSENRTVERSFSGGSAAPIDFDGNVDATNVTVVFEDNYREVDSVNANRTFSGAQTFTVDNDGNISTTDIQLTVEGSETTATESTSAGSEAPGEVEVDGNERAEGTVTFVGQTTTTQEFTSGTLLQDPAQTYTIAVPKAANDVNLETTTKTTTTIPADGTYQFDVPYSAGARDPDDDDDEKYEVTYKVFECGDGSCTKLTEWQTGKDEWFGDYHNTGGNKTFSANLEKGNYLKFSVDAECTRSDCEGQISKNTDGVSYTTDPAGEVDTVDLGGTEETGDVTFTFTGKEGSAQTYDFGDYSVSGNFEDPLTSERTKTVYTATEDAEHTVTFDWKTTATTTSAYGGCCFYGKATLKVFIPEDDRVLLEKQVDVSGDEHPSDEKKSGTFEQTLDLDEGDSVRVKLTARSGATSEINSDSESIIVNTPDSETGEVTVTFNGQTKTTDYLSPGDTDSVTFDGASPGEYDVTLDASNGNLASYEAEWEETHEVKNPGLDVDGDGSAEAQYSGVLGDGEQGTASLDLDPGTYTVKGTSHPESARFEWEYEWTETSATTGVAVTRDGTVVAERTDSLGSGETWTTTVAPVSAGSSSDVGVEVSGADATVNVNYTERDGVHAPSVKIGGETCSVPDAVTSRTVCELSVNPQGSTPVEASVDDGTLQYHVNYTARAETQSATVTIGDQTFDYPGDFAGNSADIDGVSSGETTVSVEPADETVDGIEMNPQFVLDYTAKTTTESPSVVVVAGDGTETAVDIPESAITSGTLQREVTVTVSRTALTEGVNEVRVVAGDGEVIAAYDIRTPGAEQAEVNED